MTATVHDGRGDPSNYFELAVRINAENPNHHLYNNNGTWFVHFTVYPTAVTKHRVRTSLRTKCLLEARERRDALFASLEGHARRVRGVAA